MSTPTAYCPKCGAEIAHVRLVETHYDTTKPTGNEPAEAVPVTVAVDVSCDVEPLAIAVGNYRLVWAEISDPYNGVPHELPHGKLLTAGSLHRVHVCPTAV